MTLIKLREAVEILEKAGILGEETKQKEQALKRLLNQGLILGEKPPVNQPKRGWLVDVDSLNEYIQVGKLKKHEMIKELIESRRKVRDLIFLDAQVAEVPLEEVIQSLEETSPATHIPEVQQEEEKEETISEVPKDYNFTISKLNILEKQNSKTYKVEFLLNKERFEGSVSTEFHIQFVEIHNETTRFVLGNSEEETEYLEALASKMNANIVRKIKAYEKDRE